MEFEEVVRKRRMVRHFTDEPVPIETVREIVAVAQRDSYGGLQSGGLVRRGDGWSPAQRVSESCR